MAPAQSRWQYRSLADGELIDGVARSCWALVNSQASSTSITRCRGCKCGCQSGRIYAFCASWHILSWIWALMALASCSCRRLFDDLLAICCRGPCPMPLRDAYG